MKTNSVYNEQGQVITHYKDLPYGYFYKGKFYKSVNSAFKALEQDGIVGTTHYTNGTWEFYGITYQSLQEIYDNNPDEFENVSFAKLRRNWQDYGITHNSTPCVKYWYEQESEKLLYLDKEWVMIELENENYNIRYLGDAERVEEEYFQTISEQEIIAYCKKSIKKRIAILESWLKQ